MYKAHDKNVYILDIKQKTFKVLFMPECTYFWKKTKDKQSCLNIKIITHCTKLMTSVYIFWKENVRHTKLFII